MSASACLRISLDLSDEKLAKLDAVSPLVARVTTAFLESRWKWPKTHELVTPFCFVLFDPKAMALDIAALEVLAEELQQKLFGTSHTGEVTLLVLDSDEADTNAFMTMSHKEIRDIFREPIAATPFGGRLLAVNSRPGFERGAQWRALTSERTPAIAAPSAAAAFEPEMRGIYFIPRQTFIGSAVSAALSGEPAKFSLVDGVDSLPRDCAEQYDISSIQAAVSLLSEATFTGFLYVPISFSSLSRRSTREYYSSILQTVPLGLRNRLAVSVYDLPRLPTFWAISRLHDLLTGHFASIDLQVDDPGFEVENLPPGSVNSVTYRLPTAAEKTRLKSAKYFLQQHETFKRLRIWPAITNVVTAAELELCILARAPFISGRAVCGPQAVPIGSKPCNIKALPLQLAHNEKYALDA